MRIAEANRMIYTSTSLFRLPTLRFQSVNLARSVSSQQSKGNVPILHIPSASVYRFSASNVSEPILDIDWTIHEGESWAILGHAAEEKNALLETLNGQSRIKPPPPNGIWPFLFDRGLDAMEHVRNVSFAHRPRAVGGGGFYDYSARYGAVRESDVITLRQSLLESVSSGEDVERRVVSMAEALELTQFLDLPFVALSNGQTRRSRIVKALLKKPEVLLLDEPLTGLDKHHRPRLMSLLHALHQTSSPRIIISLRMQDPIPDWITHIALVRPGGQVITSKKAGVLAVLGEDPNGSHSTPKIENPVERTHNDSDPQRTVLVDLQGVNVAYHERHILKSITWTIREGERWLLQGPNGSGKTTLLSLITGDHPQSYTQTHLHLFGEPRRRLATPTIARRIGIASPELYNAFPRRSGAQGLTVRDAIATGFEGIFTYRRPTSEQKARVDSLLEELGPATWSHSGGPSITANFAKRVFADLTSGEQSLVLFLRAIVNHPDLLILDEAFSGMDEKMVEVTKRYLRDRLGENQSVVWVSHWESEAPWGIQDGVQTFSLEPDHVTRQ